MNDIDNRTVIARLNGILKQYDFEIVETNTLSDDYWNSEIINNYYHKDRYKYALTFKNNIFSLYCDYSHMIFSNTPGLTIWWCLDRTRRGRNIGNGYINLMNDDYRLKASRSALRSLSQKLCIDDNITCNEELLLKLDLMGI
jgi:hypothetical protein